MESTVINFMAPPIPYFIGSGTMEYEVGEKHVNRYKIGVFDLVVVIKGALCIGENNKEWVVKENEGLILLPDQYHFGPSGCKEETSILWVHFNTVGVWAENNSMNEYIKNLQQLKDSHKIHGIPSSFIQPISLPKHSQLSEKALGFIKELTQLQEEPRTIGAWKQQTVFQQLFQHMDCEQTLPQDLSAIKIAEQTKKFIHNHYQQPITNLTLKKELNFHPNYIARCMKKLYGYTPLEYLTQYRLNKAKNLLLNTEYSMERIAEEVGFELPTFSNSFKNNEGVSPLNYRKKYRK